MAPSPQHWGAGILSVIQIVNLKKATLFAVIKHGLGLAGVVQAAGRDYSYGGIPIKSRWKRRAKVRP